MIREDILKKEILEANTSRGLQNIMNNTANMFIDAVKNQMVPDFYNEVKHIDDIMEALGNYLNFEGDVEKEKIYYFASLNTILYLAEKLGQNEIYDMEDIASYKYMKEILQSLYENGPLPQCSLAKHVGTEHHNLSNIMSRTKKFQLWSIRKRGNYNYYHLTKKGKNVYCALVENSIKKEPDSLEQFLIFSIKAIEEESPHVDNIVMKINQRYGCNIIKSQNVKLQLQSYIERRNPWIKSRREREKEKVIQEFMNKDIIKEETEVCNEYYDYQIEEIW